MNNRDLLNRIKPLKDIQSINSIILFGSQVQGKARPDSDIDIAVIMNNPSLKDESKAIGIGNEKYDISLFHKLPLIVKFRVLKEGSVIFCRDDSYLKKVKLDTIKFYLDFAPIINRFYKKVIENV